MVLDWKANKDEALRNGVEIRKLLSTEEICFCCESGSCENTVFRNFPKLSMEGIALVGCRFEDCGDITLDECSVESCTIRSVASLLMRDCKVTGSAFAELSCDRKEDTLIALEDTTLGGCTFSDIALKEGSYLVDGCGDCWIENCRFENIATSRDDLEIIHCEETVGKVFKKKKEFCIVDEDSCTGLDSIAVLDGAC